MHKVSTQWWGRSQNKTNTYHPPPPSTLHYEFSAKKKEKEEEEEEEEEEGEGEREEEEEVFFLPSYLNILQKKNIHYNGHNKVQ